MFGFDIRFIPMVKAEWIRLSNLPPHLRIKALKEPIRRWSKEVYWYIDNNIKALQDHLNKLEKFKTRPLGMLELSREKALKSKLHSWTIRKSQLLKQYSKCKNITNKDDNTKYFYALANFRMKKNHINKLKIGGMEICGRTALNTHIRHHFSHHFQQIPLPHVTLLLGSLKRIPLTQSSELKLIPFVEGILCVIKSCNLGKAPDYDGYNLKFLLSMWDTIRGWYHCLCSVFLWNWDFHSSN